MFARVSSLLLIATALVAHDLYLRPDSFRPKAGATMRIEYHNGDSFPSSEVPATIARLRDTKLLAAGTDSAFRDFRIEGTATVADVSAPAHPGNFVLMSRTIPNFIELAAAKFEEYLKHESLDHVIEWRKKNGESSKPGREIYSKYVKALGIVVGTSNSYASVAGLTVEFVPLENPYTLKVGQVLPVRVLFRGKPAAGLAVEASNAAQGRVTKKVVGRTGADGVARVPIEQAGLWKLHTIVMERLQDTSKADWESFWASMTFEIGQ